MSAQSLAPVQQHIVPLADLERMATAIARSGLFGVKEPAQAIALCLIAQAEGKHPASAAMEYHIIQGKPSRKAEAMLSIFQASGGKVQWHTLTSARADATFSHPQGGEARIEWTWEMASKITIDEWVGPPGQRTKKSKLLTEKDNWKNYPRAMLRSRCISEGVRTVYPAATGGMYTPEEVRDFPAEKEVSGEVVSLTHQPADPPPEPEPPIGQKSRAHIELSDRIKELQLDREYVKGVVQRKFTRHQVDGFHLYHLSANEQYWLMGKLPAIAVHKFRELIGNMTDPAELANLGRTPPPWLQGDDLAAVLLEIDDRLSAIAVKENQ